MQNIMTTIGMRFSRVLLSIQLINKYIADAEFTEAVRKHTHQVVGCSPTIFQTFIASEPGSDNYKDRAAILQEFLAAAENLNLAQSHPLRQTRLEFWETARLIYGMRGIIAHKYGIADVRYDLVWDTLTNTLGKVVVEVQEIIQEHAKETNSS
jgi:uncharacterized protein with HEPN domain